ncbi:hypothetical protein HY024_01530 [Candidatus Curtissbacteria bacterium]|nr:hypothetical protein [Candidatus Curtissbacteria bacterium]
MSEFLDYPIEEWVMVRKPSQAMDLLPDGTRLSGEVLREHIFSGDWEECQLPVIERRPVVATNLIAIPSLN